jgi:hypothetical protein
MIKLFAVEGFQATLYQPTMFPRIPIPLPLLIPRPSNNLQSRYSLPILGALLFV